jgi:hypothetical protein
MEQQQKPKQFNKEERRDEGKLIRIMSKDIPASMNVYAGLRRI